MKITRRLSTKARFVLLAISLAWLAWDLHRTGNAPKVWEIESPWKVLAPVFSPNGKYIAFTHGHQQGITVLDAATGAVVGDFSETHEFALDGAVGRLLFTPDSATMIDCDSRRTLLFDVATGKQTRKLPGVGNFNTVSPGGRHLVGLGKKEVILLDLVSGHAKKLSKQDAEWGQPSFTRDDRCVFAVDRKHGKAVFWTKATGAVAETPTGLNQLSVKVVAESTDGEKFAVIDAKGSLRFVPSRESAVPFVAPPAHKIQMKYPSGIFWTDDNQFLVIRGVHPLPDPLPHTSGQVRATEIGNGQNFADSRLLLEPHESAGTLSHGGHAVWSGSRYDEKWWRKLLNGVRSPYRLQDLETGTDWGLPCDADFLVANRFSSDSTRLVTAGAFYSDYHQEFKVTLWRVPGR